MEQFLLTPWSITAQSYRAHKQSQIESIFCQGNGYLGLRCATEEDESGRTHGMFVAGSFCAESGGVPELPNLPDPCGMEILMNGEPLTLASGCKEYRHTLDLTNGLSTRTFCTGAGNAAAKFCFERFVPLTQHHLICQRVRVTALEDICFVWTVGLDGSATNSGVQLLGNAVRRCTPGSTATLELTCSSTGVPVCLASVPQLSVSALQAIAMDRRSIGTRYTFTLHAGESATLYHTAAVFTGRDKEYLGVEFTGAQDARTCCEAAAKRGFDSLYNESTVAWAAYWAHHDVQIDSIDSTDQTALRFALYHLRVMTPVHDERMNIGAKGLSGEAYKGHTFWDTEMFLLPPWLLTEPDVARRLLVYRWHTLPKARKKAASGGWAGAQMPWESAWITDGEATPDEGEPDVVTGKPIPIRTGTQEIHVSADVAWAVHCYWMATHDVAFMKAYGCELILATALFWTSRVQWNEAHQRYELCGVIGPDEYSEDVDNNAYTNHMAAFAIRTGLALLEHALTSPARFAFLATKQEILEWEPQLRDVTEKLYCPQPDHDGIIPQDDSFCTLPALELAPYKSGEKKLLDDYNVDQLCALRVAKQADVAMLLTLFPDRWGEAINAANYAYYEECCVHDSSLSFNVFSRLAAAVGQWQDAYMFFKKASQVDLNTTRSAAQGIHAAAMGGIWLCAVQGFAGVELREDGLAFAPRLPTAWKQLSFALCWRGRRIQVEVSHSCLRLTQDGQTPIPVIINGVVAALGMVGEWMY